MSVDEFIENLVEDGLDNNTIISFVRELQERLRTAEEERDQLRQQIEACQKQDCVAETLWLETGSDHRYIVAAEKPNSLLMGDKLYASPVAPAQQSPHITEQQARELITAWCSYIDGDDGPIPDFEWFSPSWQNRLKIKLRKLNSK